MLLLAAALWCQCYGRHNLRQADRQKIRSYGYPAVIWIVWTRISVINDGKEMKIVHYFDRIDKSAADYENNKLKLWVIHWNYNRSSSFLLTHLLQKQFILFCSLYIGSCLAFGHRSLLSIAITYQGNLVKLHLYTIHTHTIWFIWLICVILVYVLPLTNCSILILFLVLVVALELMGHPS